MAHNQIVFVVRWPWLVAILLMLKLQRIALFFVRLDTSQHSTH